VRHFNFRGNINGDLTVRSDARQHKNSFLEIAEVTLLLEKTKPQPLSNELPIILYFSVFTFCFILLSIAYT